MNSEVRDYLDAVPADRRQLVMALHDLITGLYPDAGVDMQYRMPTYHRGGAWVALANQKHYVSLYTCGPQHLREFQRRQPGIKTGKGCINLRPGSDLPLEDLADVVRHAMEASK